jgi:stage II sporulation protein M
MYGIRQVNIVWQRTLMSASLHVRQYLAHYLIIGFFLLVGLSAGVFTVSALPDDQMDSVSAFLKAFFKVLKNSTPDIGAILWESLMNNLKLLLVLFLCGFQIYLIPVSLVTVGVKGFMVGFTISAFILKYAFGGVLIAAICVIPPNLIIIACYMRLCAACIHNGIERHKLKRALRNRRVQVNYAPYVQLSCKICIACILGIMLESILAPFVLKLFAGLVA